MKHWEALGSTRKHLEELRSTRKLLEALESTGKYQEAPRSTGKPLRSDEKHQEAGIYILILSPHQGVGIVSDFY